MGRSAEGVCVGGRVFVGGRSFADRQFLVLSFVVFNCLDMYPFAIGSLMHFGQTFSLKSQALF